MLSQNIKWIDIENIKAFNNGSLSATKSSQLMARVAKLPSLVFLFRCCIQGSVFVLYMRAWGMKKLNKKSETRG